jgi:hypothetical protein
LKNAFDQNDTELFINRIEKLTATSKPNWGKMAVAQMLAHCSVTYEKIYDYKHPASNAFKKMLLKLFVKNMVVSEKPYKKNGTTAPEFIIKDNKDFGTEKKRLIDYINETQKLGATYFEGKESHSFGILTKQEWSNMLSKHLDHHLTQFGV